MARVRELGHLVLYVRDLERSRRFYRDVLGWPEVTVVAGIGVAFSTGRTHHELLLIEVGAQAAPVPAGRRVGLYHFGLNIGESDDDLRRARDELLAAGAEIVGTADHTVTHSLYVRDPDGNEIELYIDALPSEVWTAHPELLASPIRPLAL